MTIEENVPLAPFTSFRIGGPARFLLHAAFVTEIKDALAFADGRKLPVFVLGGGSNVLVADEGFSGVVLKLELGGIEWKGERVTAAASEVWDPLPSRTSAPTEASSGIRSSPLRCSTARAGK